MRTQLTLSTTVLAMILAAPAYAQTPPPSEPAPAAEPANPPAAEPPAAAPATPAPMTPAPLPPPPAPLDTTPLPPPPPVAAPAPELPSVVSKFKVQIYGFTELDMIRDSTQSLNDLAGNATIARPGSYANSHSRAMFGVRNSRVGLKVGGPSSDTIKTSGIVEMDFLGNQPSNPPTTTESAFFTNPTMRVRHMALKLETPYIDVLAGQYWELFGWQPYFDPASVQIQGLPGEVFSRTPQLRLSHTFKTDPVNFEIAVAASRPPQRDGHAADGQGGLRLTVNDWKGYRTTGGTGTNLDSAAIGVSGTVRHFSVQELSATPTIARRATGWGVSIDALLPVIPASKTNHDNALTLTGSFATGSGFSDVYTGLNGGVGYPNVTNAAGASVAFAPDIDQGIVTYDAAGKLHTVDWRSFIVGLQYYLPVGGLWIAGNYSNMHSGNIDSYGASKAGVFKDTWFADGSLFWDVSEGARIGGEYAHFEQKYADDKKAKNDRLQASFFYIF